MGLFLIVASTIAIVLFKKREPIQVLTGFALLLVAFFALPTRVHERYLVQAFAILAIIWATKLWHRVALIVLSIANTLNLHAILAKDLDVQNMSVSARDPGFAVGITDAIPFQGKGPEGFGISWVRLPTDFAREEWVIWLIVAIHLAALVLVAIDFIRCTQLEIGRIK
jgi:4-amino-4-deoxy-L-arabinose transferase-like glycosyltransferase